jgi:hypothetical protein
VAAGLEKPVNDHYAAPPTPKGVGFEMAVVSSPTSQNPNGRGAAQAEQGSSPVLPDPDAVVKRQRFESVSRALAAAYRLDLTDDGFPFAPLIWLGPRSPAATSVLSR